MQPSLAAVRATFRAALASYANWRALKLAVGPAVVFLLVGALYFSLPLIMLATGAMPVWAQAIYVEAAGIVQTLLTVLHQLALILVVALWSTPAAVAQIEGDYPAASAAPDAMPRLRGAIAHYIGTYIVLCALVQFVATAPLLYAGASLAIQAWLVMRLLPYLALRKRASASEFEALRKRWRLPLAGVAIAAVILSGLIAAAVFAAIRLLLPGPAAVGAGVIGRVLGMLFLVYWFAHLSLLALSTMRTGTAPAATTLP